MDLGTCQDGLMVTATALVARIGVGLSGAPTTTREISTGRPDSITTRDASGTLTRIYWSPGSWGIQRRRSILTAICCARTAAGTFSMETVRSFSLPSGVMALSLWYALTAAVIA